MAVVVSVFCFDGAVSNADFRSPRLACHPFHIDQNDNCLQVVMHTYSIHLGFGRVCCKFIIVDRDRISPIEHHPCNVEELLLDCCCFRPFRAFCDGGDELVELVVVH
jgi:hypothetical protein